MKKRSLMNFGKNAVGTVFLLVGAFFVCSTLLSMRAVLADPIAPAGNVAAPQNNTSGRSTARANPRGNVTARPTRQTSVTDSGRGVATRGVTARQRSTDGAGVARTTAERGVVSRSLSRAKSGTRSGTMRNVRSRNAAGNEARVSLAGDAIRGSKSSNSSYYTYASGKLYSGNYSNIIDATTGLISADAYSSCLEAYYTCMDEICTARNEAQRRCACAGRVKSFAAAESALESANEELIQVSGELALLVANEGKAVSAAFTLTDAEKVMNCASWKEVTQQYGTSSAEAKQWCYTHGIYGTSSSTITYNGSKMTGMFVSDCTKPAYCNKSSNGLDFDADDLDGTSSDILASLAEWANTVKENTDTLLGSNDKALFSAVSDWANETSGLTDISLGLDDETTQDTLANTWGYQLFEYAHNNVCSRVLDSCFNGIYESCGTPPSGGRCANGASSSCPYNYNSKITVSASGDVTLNERGSSSASASASCFGYTSTSGDPYTSLRGPVADARRSVMQKYLLDANADCDLYGEQLKTAAQKITYQKVAAQQALQKKRLEFYNNDQTKTLNDATVAGTNFNECISELYDCYETQETSHPGWTTARIKTYCAQIDNSPSCYQDMICNPSYAQFKAVIDKADNEHCTWHSSDYTQNTCRNIVTLNEILNPIVSGNVSKPTTTTSDGNSSAFREACLREALGCGEDGKTGCIRSWTTSAKE